MVARKEENYGGKEGGELWWQGRRRTKEGGELRGRTMMAGKGENYGGKEGGN